MVMVPTGLLDLGKRLLGRREIAGLEGLTQGCEGILAGGLAAGGGCALGRVLLEGAEGLLGRREIRRLRRRRLSMPRSPVSNWTAAV